MQADRYSKSDDKCSKLVQSKNQTKEFRLKSNFILFLQKLRNTYFYVKFQLLKNPLFSSNPIGNS